MTGGGAIHREYGLIDTATFDPSSWPDGQHYMDILTQEGVPPNVSSGNADYWQAAVRWALLTKHDLLLVGEEKEEEQDALKKIGYEVMEGTRKLVLSNVAIKVIRTRWRALIDQARNSSSSKSSMPKELQEFLTTGKSNGRVMHWTVLECPAGLQFTLHAHPNMEIIFSCRGELHEVRMKGEPVTTEFETKTTTSSSDGGEQVKKVIYKGPNLTNVSRPWSFNTVREGEFLVNELGSVHKTFTASKGREGSSDNGCVLLVLWGGDHADVAAEEQPTAPNVQVAVDQMDRKLCSCATGGNWEVIQETFLPETERSHKNPLVEEPR